MRMNRCGALRRIRSSGQSSAAGLPPTLRPTSFCLLTSTRVFSHSISYNKKCEMIKLGEVGDGEGEKREQSWCMKVGARQRRGQWCSVKAGIDRELVLLFHGWRR